MDFLTTYRAQRRLQRERKAEEYRVLPVRRWLRDTALWTAAGAAVGAIVVFLSDIGSWTEAAVVCGLFALGREVVRRLAGMRAARRAPDH